MVILFTTTSVTVTNSTGETVLEGRRDPLRNLYIVPIEDSPAHLRVDSSTIVSLERLPQHSAASAYEIQAAPALISYLYAAAGYPTKETWL